MGIAAFRKIGGPMRILIIYVIFCFIVESMAVFAAYRYQNNLLVYDIAGPFEMALTCLYFGKTISILDKRKLAVPLAILFFLLGNGINLLNWYSGLPQIDMMPFFGCATISLGLLQFWDILRQEQIQHWRSDTRFWVSAIFVCFYALTFFLFAIIEHFAVEQDNSKVRIFFYLLSSVAIFCNIAFIYVFRLHVKSVSHVR